MSGPGDPHAEAPLRRAGVALDRARGAVVAVHGRGATAESILALAPALDVADVAWVAPQAAGGAWYPHGFMAPLASNEPWLASALAAVGRALGTVSAAGVAAERTVLLGFSQGACLAAEYAARHARRYGGLAALSGGLIGPDGTPRAYAHSLAGTPAFLGCGDRDAHIPAGRVRESARVLESLGGVVTARLYPALGHTVNDDELEAVRGMLRAVVRAAGAAA